MIEFFLDSAYTVLGVVALILTLENVEKKRFLEYVEHNSHPWIPGYNIRMLIAILSYAFQGHGMFLISLEKKDSPAIIFLYVFSLVTGLLWYFTFYNFKALRTSLTISFFSVVLSVHIFWKWYLMGLFIWLFMIPYTTNMVINFTVSLHMFQKIALLK
ncbi:ORF-16 [Teiidae poxvirus 1]|nr:ORF-16 [Teiidae poxvirus 1]